MAFADTEHKEEISCVEKVFCAKSGDADLLAAELGSCEMVSFNIKGDGHPLVSRCERTHYCI